MWDEGTQAVLAEGVTAGSWAPSPAMEGGIACVAVTRLDLTDFRSYGSARLDCDSRPLVLTGANGAGKTNLLEALSFLAPGRGLRRARLSEIDRRPSSGDAGQPWAVAARLDTQEGPVAIGTGRDPGREAAVLGERTAETSERRLVRIDGQAIKGQAALAGYLNLVWLTPQMDRLFQEGASPRRRFLDRLVFGFDAEHAQRLTAYDHALRERSRLLRDGVTDAGWLSLLEEKMACEGVAVAAARLHTVARLDRAAGSSVTPFPMPRIAVGGVVENWLASMPALAAEEKLAAELAAARRVDAAAGGALVGPHRSDLLVQHADKNVAADQCSTGEQKALLIAIVLAHARLRMEESRATPILLLDEVVAHLDGTRRRALFEQLLALRCQAWLTGTDAHLFKEFDNAAQFFTVADGAILRDRQAAGPPMS